MAAQSIGEGSSVGTPGSTGPKKGQAGAQATANARTAGQSKLKLTGEGAQFIYAAATVANILCENLTQQQINLLANFLSVVTTSVYAVLTVENPNQIIEG